MLRKCIGLNVGVVVVSFNVGCCDYFVSSLDNISVTLVDFIISEMIAFEKTHFPKLP